MAGAAYINCKERKEFCAISEVGRMFDMEKSELRKSVRSTTLSHGGLIPARKTGPGRRVDQV